MPIVEIQGTIINFPDSGSSPNWAPAVIQFAEAVQNALAVFVGPADVAPQSFVLDSFNPGTNVNIPNLSFSTTTVRGAFIRYSLYRSTTTSSAWESGLITLVYNPNGPTNNKWERNREYVGDGKISFNVTDQGQVQLTTTSLSGIDHVGTISYTAQALLQTE